MSYPFEYLRRTLWPVHTQKAFLLYPFSGDGEKFCEEVVKPAVKDAGLQVEDAKAKSGNQPILEDILTGIASADVVVGVLVGRNPNVLWEIGIAHAWKPASQVLTIDTKNESGKNRIPFNLQGFRHIIVDDSDQDKTKCEIAERLKCLCNEHDTLCEEAIWNARNSLGPSELTFLMRWGNRSNFVLLAHHVLSRSDGYSQPTDGNLANFAFDGLHVGPKLLATHIDGIVAGNLCRLGLLACATAHPSEYLEFSFWWTPLGNEVLHKVSPEVVPREEVSKRLEKMPAEIRSGRGYHIFGPILQR